MTRRKREIEPRDPAMAEHEEEKHKAFLLQALRSASARLKAWDNELILIGTTLKDGLIGADSALQWVRDYDLLWLLPHIPVDVGRIVRQEAPPISEGFEPKTGVQDGDEAETGGEQ